MKTFLAILAFALGTSAQAKLIEGVVTLDFPNDKMPDVTKGWKGLVFESGQVIDSPQAESQQWDLRMKQMYPGTNGGKVAMIDLKKKENFSSVRQAPSDEREYAADVVEAPPGPGNKPVRHNKTLIKWCDYSIWNHSCAPARSVFVLKTADGRYAKILVVRYVRNGKDLDPIEKGPDYGQDGLVHMTLRYKINTVAGDRTLE